MGRFASTASLYEQLRPPYPPEFFRSVAETLTLSKRDALIDLGTGPGLLALGFAPYVGRIVGVDPEPSMLAAAQEAAARAGQDFTLIEGKAEESTRGHRPVRNCHDRARVTLDGTRRDAEVARTNGRRGRRDPHLRVVRCRGRA